MSQLALVQTANHGKPATPLRLNLGCGDKILPGYINIDTAAERKGKKPDVIADIKNLNNIKSAIADEILAVHVIEHFYYWEVIPLLAGWRRIIKKGGKIILECPNLLFACQTIISNPETACLPDQRGQFSMWPLYGDPSWRDGLMCHKWGYTPHSLKEALKQAGYTNARQQPAQFKMKEPRDMRVIAYNPNI